jgi:hypothetical protein
VKRLLGIQSLITGDGAARPLAHKLFYNTFVGFGEGRLLEPNGAAADYEGALYNVYKCLADEGQGAGAPATCLRQVRSFV